MEKSLRLQNADLLTEYNLIEADLARPKVKEADFRGKAKHLEYKARDHQPAMLCTLVMTDNIDAKGVARYPVGTMPVMDPATGETLVDELGRRSFTTSIAYGPTIGKNIALAYLPLGLLPGRPQAQRRVFRRDLPGRGRGGRLQAALRSGEPQAAQLMRCAISRCGQSRIVKRLRRTVGAFALLLNVVSLRQSSWPISVYARQLPRHGGRRRRCSSWLAAAHAAAEPVDVELVLAVDVSLSMSPMELDIQRKGYAAALTDDRVLQAIARRRPRQDRGDLFRMGGHHLAARRRAVDASSPTGRMPSVSRRSCPRSPPNSARRTSISAALEFGADLFAESQFPRHEAGHRHLRRRSQQPGRAGRCRRATRVVEQGIIINGLPLMTSGGITSAYDVADLDRYYSDCVIGGPGAFMIPVNDWSQFPEAIRRKLVLELAGPRSPAWRRGDGGRQPAGDPGAGDARRPTAWSARRCGATAAGCGTSAKMW